MSDEIRTAVDLRTSIVDQRGGIERFDGPQRRLLDALVFELAKKPNEIDVRVVTDLTAMLPRPVSAPERDNHPDPRLVMWQIYKTMRERGEIDLKPLTPSEAEIAELKDENAALKAQLVGAGLAPALPDSTAITPREVVPPGELGECYVGSRPGPDDPKPPVTIEAKAVRAASAAAPPPRPAWEDWHDAQQGGAHYDRWGNHNV